MTTTAKLLARRQQLIARLEDDPGPREREEIETLLEQINIALELLDEGRPVPSQPDEP